MPAEPKNNNNYVDLVFEGGGVKGIGLAGAYSVLEERGFEAEEHRRHLGRRDHGRADRRGLHRRRAEARSSSPSTSTQFKDEGWEDKVPSSSRAASMLLDQGIYEGKPFLEWMRGLLAAKGVHTFRRPDRRGVRGRPEYRYNCR